MQVGTTSGVPVSIISPLGLTNLSFVVKYPTNRFTNWVMVATNGAIVAVALQSAGAQTLVNLSTLPGQVLTGPTVVGSLTFAALLGHSAFVPLGITNVIGTTVDGAPVGNAVGGPGRVVVIGPEPLLEAWLSANRDRMLTLYGNPGASYEVDYTTNLSSEWQYAWRVPMTNLSEVFVANGSLPQVFYRDFAFSANPPILELSSLTQSNLVLLVYGRTGTNYSIISSSNLSSASNWTQIAGFTPTNSFQFINAGGATNHSQFFRVKER
jgi:hypothetical protein